MADRYVEEVDAREDEVQEVRPGPGSAFAGVMMMLGSLVTVAIVAVLALLGFRLGFMLGEANAANDFVEFIYDASGPLVDPFAGIANERQLDNGGTFEPETVIAMAVYAVAALLVLFALRALASGALSADQETTTHRRRIVRES
jgi:hypothetical protein